MNVIAITHTCLESFEDEVNSKSVKARRSAELSFLVSSTTGYMERFIGSGARPNAVTVSLGLSNEGKGSEEYIQIRATLQVATFKLNFI